MKKDDTAYKKTKEIIKDVIKVVWIKITTFFKRRVSIIL